MVSSAFEPSESTNNKEALKVKVRAYMHTYNVCGNIHTKSHDIVVILYYGIRSAKMLFHEKKSR